MELTEGDLRFLVETVAFSRREQQQMIGRVRHSEVLLHEMLDDPKLVVRLLDNQEVLVRVSPGLMFTVLLHQVRRELQDQIAVYEPGALGRRVPIFDAPHVAELLADKEALSYLVDLLCSFSRTHSGLVYWREHGRWQHRRFSDMDLDDLIALASLAEPEYRPQYFRRIADLALFLSGVYPDQAALFRATARRFRVAERSLSEYEQEGQRFYALAAREAEQPGLQAVFEMLAERFTLARRALNSLSDRYLKTLRGQFFQLPAQ